MSELSPMQLGPVDHGIAEMPLALNLENYWQGSKVFDNEVDKNNNPTKKFYKTQKNYF
jgi:hypothetical protein